MSKTHTNVAPLWLNASALLQLTGRIHENELWVENPETRRFIDEKIMKCATEIADWLGCDLVKRQPVPVVENATVTILPFDAAEEAA